METLITYFCKSLDVVHQASIANNSLFRHVQVNNEGAIAFYKKFGFEVVDLKQNYYKRIEPADAYVLQKNLKDSVPPVTTESTQHNGNFNGTSSSIDSN